MHHTWTTTRQVSGTKCCHQYHGCLAAKHIHAACLCICGGCLAHVQYTTRCSGTHCCLPKPEQSRPSESCYAVGLTKGHAAVTTELLASISSHPRHCWQAQSSLLLQNDPSLQVSSKQAWQNSVQPSWLRLVQLQALAGGRCCMHQCAKHTFSKMLLAYTV